LRRRSIAATKTNEKEPQTVPPRVRGSSSRDEAASRTEHLGSILARGNARPRIERRHQTIRLRDRHCNPASVAANRTVFVCSLRAARSLRRYSGGHGFKQ